MYSKNQRKSAVTAEAAADAGSLPGVRGRIGRKHDPDDHLRVTCIHCSHPVRILGPGDLWECASCAWAWQRRREHYGDVKPAYGGR